MARFNAPGAAAPAAVFLMQTRAAGLGTDLPGVDALIFFDSDWSAKSDVQALSHAYRVGSPDSLRVYRLYTRGTVEERLLQLSDRMAGMEALFTQSHGRSYSAGAAVFEDVLRWGAEALFAAPAAPAAPVAAPAPAPAAAAAAAKTEEGGAPAAAAEGDAEGAAAAEPGADAEMADAAAPAAPAEPAEPEAAQSKPPVGYTDAQVAALLAVDPTAALAQQTEAAAAAAAAAAPAGAEAEAGAEVKAEPSAAAAAPAVLPFGADLAEVAVVDLGPLLREATDVPAADEGAAARPLCLMRAVCGGRAWRYAFPCVG